MPAPAPTTPAPSMSSAPLETDTVRHSTKWRRDPARAFQHLYGVRLSTAQKWISMFASS
jgi:hypothetical protein